MMPTIAIVGRPNVGKSTLFNRIARQRKAIVEDMPGVTRDRIYAEVRHYERPFLLVDTGGYEPASDHVILSRMRAQTEVAIREADAILFLMDVTCGVHGADVAMADLLRRQEKPVFYVVNKADSPAHEIQANEFYALGIDRFYPISAEHGLGVGELIEEALKSLPPGREDAEEDGEIRIAIIGRPNVGKSSLVNRLLGADRVLVSPIPGTTRDTIDTRFNFNGRRYLLIDTAGIRRKAKVDEKLEKISVIQAIKAISRAHVVLMVVDAESGITEQDLTVAGYAFEKDRAVILVVNKWDLIAKDNTTFQEFSEEVRAAFKFLSFAPLLFVSALTGQRVSKILAEIEKIYQQFDRSLPTPALNKALQEAVERRPPPLFRGKRVKLFYITQTAVRPPTLTVFASRSEGLNIYYRRYLANQLRAACGLEGVPLRMVFRDREKKG
ncbi:MAG: ribosome biogenesis GTPase Der [Deltaproteobacteria bacterium]|nr:ribosome biogenesis GTPase Der [Deltaproteobacteria bacterium]